jgi:hypothetical protein
MTIGGLCRGVHLFAPVPEVHVHSDVHLARHILAPRDRCMPCHRDLQRNVIEARCSHACTRACARKEAHPVGVGAGAWMATGFGIHSHACGNTNDEKAGRYSLGYTIVVSDHEWVGATAISYNHRRLDIRENDG